MPIVIDRPPIRVGDENLQAMQQLGQGGGQLLAALLNFYRQRGRGTYTSPTGATTEVSPAERTAGGMSLPQLLSQQATQGQGSFQPSRFSGLGPVPISPSVLPRLQVQQAQAEIAKAPFEQRELEAGTRLKESQASFYEKIASGELTDVPAVRDAETGQIRPALPGETATLLISGTKGGKSVKDFPGPEPKALSARQTEAIEGLQATTATLGELEQFLQSNPAIETGLTHPSFLRNIVGDVTRSFADPTTTQMAQVANRMQDAYRRFVTGVQAGFGEVSQFLPSSIPNPATQPKAQFLAAIDTFGREIERTKIQLKRAMKLRGYSPQQIEELFAPLPKLSELGQGTQPDSLSEDERPIVEDLLK